MADMSDLKRRFKWTQDARDSWRILSAETGPLEGDCDDFAITALWLMAGKSRARMWWWLITFKAVIWHCRTERGYHAALWLRGHGWTDNIYPDWSGKCRHKRIIPVLPPVVALKLAIGQHV